MRPTLGRSPDFLERYISHFVQLQKMDPMQEFAERFFSASLWSLVSAGS
jgi:hypothetical protein